MNTQVKIMPDEGPYFVFQVSESGNEYTVRCTGEYYQKLTNGKSTAADLIKESFKYLLQHEDASQILSEFELPQIEQHFPGYEAAMRARISTIGK